MSRPSWSAHDEPWMGFLTFCLLKFWDGDVAYIDPLMAEDDLRGDANIPSFTH